MRTISVLAEIEADKHPDWNRLVKTWRGHAGLATNLAYLLYTKNEFAQPYDARHRRFGLLGLGAVGPAARPVSQRVIGVMKTDDDHQLWPLAVTALRNAQVESSSFVPLLSETLRDSNKHPYVRASAAGALGEVMPATPETLGLLRESLRDEFAVIRLAAARSLWRAGVPVEELLPVIESLLGHKLRTVRLGALKFVCEVGRVGQPLKRAVEERLTDENAEVRGAAGEALGAIDGERSD
jgi:HEAT repeat protein